MKIVSLLAEQRASEERNGNTGGTLQAPSVQQRVEAPTTSGLHNHIGLLCGSKRPTKHKNFG